MTVHSGPDHRATGVRGRPFKLFWLGQSVSFAGTQVTVVALPLVAVLALGASPAQMGLIVAAEALPSTIGPVLLGNVVDRVDRIRCLLIADYGRLVALLAVPGFALAGALSLPVVIAVAFVVGLFTVLNDVAYFSVIPSLVDDEDLVPANARLEGARATAGIVGPGVGGLLTRVFGATNAVLADCVTYLFSLVQLHRLRRMASVDPAPAVRQPWYAGLREVFTDARLRLLAFGSGFFNLFSSGAFVLIPLFLVGEVGLDPALYGLGIAFGGAGGLAGAAVAGRLASGAGVRATLAGSLLVCAVAEAVLVFAGGSDLVTFGLLAASQFAAVTAVTVYIVVNAALRQAMIPPHLRGRVFGAMRFITRGLMPVGGVVFGLVGGAVGLRSAILAVAGGQVLVASAFTLRRHLLPDLLGDDHARS